MFEMTTAVIEAVQSPTLGVRMRASWSLANCSDVLLEFPQHAQWHELVTDQIVTRIMETSVFSASDNDKCRFNGLRALGNSTRLASPSFLADQMEKLVKDAVLVAMQNTETGAVKVERANPGCSLFN